MRRPFNRDLVYFLVTGCVVGTSHGLVTSGSLAAAGFILVFLTTISLIVLLLERRFARRASPPPTDSPNNWGLRQMIATILLFVFITAAGAARDSGWPAWTWAVPSVLVVALVVGAAMCNLRQRPR
jgi:uncharacterized membrane protein YfcA